MAKIPAAFTQEAKKRVYGRRLGRPMSVSRQDVIDTLLPNLTIDLADLTEKQTLAPQALFSPSSRPQLALSSEAEGSGQFRDSSAALRSARNDIDVVLEIGFGNGEHLKAMMEQRPDRNYIGVEPFINGMSAFLKSVKDMEHKNLRVWMDDAVMLCRSLTSESLSALYILNPDPWPKKKHHKRRIVRAETLLEYHRVLKPGGTFVMATDVDALAEWMVTETMNHGGFEWQAKSSKDWQTMPEDWFIKTRYAEKGVNAGRKETYLLFKKT